MKMICASVITLDDAWRMDRQRTKGRRNRGSKDNEGRRENASVTVIGKQHLHYQPKPANLNSIFNITLFHLHGNEKR